MRPAVYRRGIERGIPLERWCIYRDCSAAGAGAKRSLARPPPRGRLMTSAILSVRRATAVYTISTFWQRRQHQHRCWANEFSHVVPISWTSIVSFVTHPFPAFSFRLFLAAIQTLSITRVLNTRTLVAVVDRVRRFETKTKKDRVFFARLTNQAGWCLFVVSIDKVTNPFLDEYDDAVNNHGR